MSRRIRTLVCGAVPVIILGALMGMERIPGTDTTLTAPYAAEGPGPSVNTLGEVDGRQVVDIQGAETDATSGNLNMTTVAVRSGMSIPEVLSRWMQGDSIVPKEQIFPDGQSPEEIQQRNADAFAESESAATIAAMNYLQRATTVEVKKVLPESAASGHLEEGDHILGVDGTPTPTPEDVHASIASHEPGETVDLDIERADGRRETLSVELGEDRENSGQPLLGVTMVSVPADGVTIDYNLNEIGGPSAGMMFSLAVIDKLSPGPLNGGKFVAGTGTISPDGSVGPIGGIRHKVSAAEDLGAELFLAPKENCGEVRNHKGNMTIVAVENLDDAIAQMKAYAEGGELNTCS